MRKVGREYKEEDDESTRHRQHDGEEEEAICMHELARHTFGPKESMRKIVIFIIE